METTFTLDSWAEDVNSDTPILYSADTGRTWNGAAVPLATADDLWAFLTACKANDRNGEWNPDGVHETDDFLISARDPADEFTTETWQWSGEVTEDGERLYPLDGWQWVRVEV